LGGSSLEQAGGSRSAAVTAEEALAAELVLLATPWNAVDAVLRIAPPWSRRVLIDAAAGKPPSRPPRRLPGRQTLPPAASTSESTASPPIPA
jgi:predicted dinucleotide-binding enzyme